MSEGTAARGPFVPEVIDWDAFGGLARAAFFTVKRALATQRPEIARRVMADDAWQHLREQVNVLRLDGCTNVQRALTVMQVRQGDHDVYGTMDRVTVGLLVDGVDYVVNASGHVVRGDRERAEWLEEWTFEKSRDPAVLEAARSAKCPNCGAPLAVDADGLCTFCQAPAPGSPAEWLVAGIGLPSQVAVDSRMDARATLEAGKVVMDAMAAQAADHPWTGSAPGLPNLAGDAAAGIAAIQARDPSFNPSDLVVEAREVFLRLEEGRNQLRPADFRALVGDDIYAREVDRARQLIASGRNEVRAYLDISRVTLTSVATDGRRDRLTARVDAVSARSVVDLHSGDLIEGSATTHPFAEELVFERSAEATTNALTGLLAHRCPACGQPSSVSDDGHCTACGRHVTGGEQDWILVSVVPAEGSAPG